MKRSLARMVVFDGVGVGAGHEEFASGFGLFAEVDAGEGHFAFLVEGADSDLADLDAELGEDASDGAGEVFLAVFDPGENFGALLWREAGVEEGVVGALGGDQVFGVGGGFGLKTVVDIGLSHRAT